MSILSAFICLSFDERSQIFILQNIDSTTIGKLFVLASLGKALNNFGGFAPNEFAPGREGFAPGRVCPWKGSPREVLPWKSSLQKELSGRVCPGRVYSGRVFTRRINPKVLVPEVLASEVLAPEVLA